MISPAKIQVRFADLDILGHVNNTIYLSYFEMARIHYFNELLGQKWDWHTLGIVLVKNEIEYIQSVLLYDEPEITLFTEQIGTKSFTFGYELNVNGKLYVKGRSVQVCFDAETKQTIPIPTQMLEALHTLERK